MSPRGRIKLMREVQSGVAPITEHIIDAFDTCIQCRGCEPACPSGVPYGRLIERAKETLAESNRVASTWQRLVMSALSMPKLLRAGAIALAALDKVGLAPRRLGLPKELSWRSPDLNDSGTDVWLFTGCVMDVFQRDVHLATKRVLEAAGVGVAFTGDKAACCGALQSHAGLASQAKRRAEKTIAALGERPVVVNSAGCGAAMKEYHHLISGEQAQEFSGRVFDVNEFLLDHLDALLASVGPFPKLDMVVAIQDPCHLRHVQKRHLATRAILEPFVKEIVELDDDGLCCGAGGFYSILQPRLASTIRQRKIEAISKTDCDLVASANPGCIMHLSAAGVHAVHPISLIDLVIGKTSASA